MSGGAYEPTAESYEPSTNVWSAAGSLSTPRRGHAATVLPDGNVLVTGGAGGFVPLSSASLGNAEAFETRTNAWTAVGVLPEGRSDGSAIRLLGGDVLIAGRPITPPASTRDTLPQQALVGLDFP